MADATSMGDQLHDAGDSVAAALKLAEEAMQTVTATKSALKEACVQLRQARLLHSTMAQTRLTQKDTPVTMSGIAEHCLGLAY